MSFNNDSEALTIFREWGVQTGHQTEWARLLIILAQYKSTEIWLIPKAKFLFDIAIKYSWDHELGGLAYNFKPNGEI